MLMNFRILITAFIFGNIISAGLYAQDYYSPESPIMVNNNSFTIASIKQKILEERVTFKDKDITLLQELLEKNNQIVDKHIRLLRRKASDLSEDVLMLEQIKTLKDAQIEIKKLENSKNDLLKTISLEAEKIIYKGMFIVVFSNIDPYDSKESLAERAELYLRTKAVENLNQRMVSAISEIEENDELKAHYTGMLDGKMEVNKVLLSKKFDSQSKYVYMGELQVTPLIKDTKAPLPEDTPLILNLQEEVGYTQKLYKKNVSDAIVTLINDHYSSLDEGINLFNEEATKDQRELFSKANKELKSLNETIAVKKREVEMQELVIQNKIENKTRIKYDEENTIESVSQAIEALKEEIKQIKQQMLFVKEKELVGFYNVEVISNGDPAEDIGRTAVETFKKMQSYTTVEPFVTIESAENIIAESGPTGTSRKFETLWIYPVAGDDDNFIITIVANFHFLELTNRENIKIDIPNIGEAEGDKGKSFSSKKSNDQNSSTGEEKSSKKNKKSKKKELNKKNKNEYVIMN